MVVQRHTGTTENGCSTPVFPRVHPFLKECLTSDSGGEKRTVPGKTVFAPAIVNNTI